MKIILIHLFFFFLLNISYGQTEYKSYFELINEAENYIICDKYDQALKIYESIFGKYCSPRGNDYYNAALVSLYASNDSLAFTYLSEAVKRGYDMEFIDNPIIKNLVGRITKWNQFVESYDSLYNYYLDKLSNPVITEFKNMIVEDQTLTAKIYFGNISQLQLDSLYYRNINRIVELIGNDSLPQIECFDMKSRKLQSIIPFILIRHYFGMVNRVIYNPEAYKGDFYDFVLNKNQYIEKELIKLIVQGRLSPVLISESIIYNNPNDPVGRLGQSFGRYITNEFDEDILVEYVTTREDYSSEEIEIINKNRQKWYLPDFNNALNMTRALDQIPDSIHSSCNKYFNYTGRIAANEFFITESDSLDFKQDCENNLIKKLGYKLDWIYLGLEKGWKLPK